MVKVISQETFNSVVKDNISEFDMTTEEAVKEAIEQFEAQGVDLSNIVKTADMAQGKDPLIICITSLQELYDNTAELDLILPQLELFKNDCKKDLSRKILAAKEGAYPILLDILDKYSNDKEVVLSVLQSLNALMDGFPDLLNERGICMIGSLLSTRKEPSTISLVLQWCRKCCLNHEHNRQNIFENGIADYLRILLDSENVEYLADLCKVIRSLTLDDDVRVQVSNSHNRAKVLAVEFLCPITDLLSKHRADNDIVNELLLTLSSLIVRNEFCAKVEEGGGIKFILDALTEFPEDEKICKSGLLLLKGLAGNDDVKVKIMQAGAPSLILIALNKHMKSEAVSSAALSAITVLALRSPSNCQTLFDEGAPELILQTMKVHSKNSKVQRHGCWALRNMVSRNRELCAEFLKLGTEEILNAVLRQHKICEADAKAALRDLGCKVDLNEPWKGKGQGKVTH
uniref:LRRK2 ARM repeat domain-containing protein n=1 Tax=Clastoptera arizonana TaxID=38151 RepID=A0A1B6CSI6_9HEMI